MSWNEYPRPQLRRQDWINLNGEWTFFVSGRDCGTISVPFCPESELSGIDRQNAGNDFSNIAYERMLQLSEIPEKKRLKLHFGAVDQVAAVFVNGMAVEQHEGGYTAFTVDITRYVHRGENRISVCATDYLDHVYPWGKQKAKRGGMWYTPVSGIWQSVWAEWVPETHVESLKIDVDLSGAEITLLTANAKKDRFEKNGQPKPFDAYAVFEGRQIPLENHHVRLEPENPEPWTPEHPKLYEFTVVYGEDRVESYFALRTLSVKTVDGIQRLCLNGEPYFFNGALDQGYFQNGIYTPMDETCFAHDILSMKRLGFNMLRKHIKVEPEAYYYACDRLGMVVFQDMVQTGNYSFLRDSVLPTIGIKKLNDRNLHRDKAAREYFYRSMEETVNQLRNHPCICLWTIFNEGWGQFAADEAYERLKKLDDSRFIDATSGWFWQKKSDVESQHIYFKKLKLKKSRKELRPQFISEYGGYVYKVPGHAFNQGKDYGYKIFKDRQSYIDALKALQEEVKALIPAGLSAAVYTQVSDVEDEVNGLLTYDREVDKTRE